MKESLTIPGNPMGKQRPRVCKFGTYTPKETVNYETLVREMYIIGNYGKQLEGALEMIVDAHFPIPKVTSKKKREQMSDYGILPTKKPDCDNILKIIADALNGLAYHDDSQIVTAQVTKVYSDYPKVVVTIREIFEQTKCTCHPHDLAYYGCRCEVRKMVHPSIMRGLNEAVEHEKGEGK